MIIHKLDDPAVGGTLIAAGMLPVWFTSADLAVLYYCLLIPPAAWHFWLWYKKMRNNRNKK